MPERIQRKRTKGWKMPPNTVSVCRPSIWGNPFVADDSAAAVEAYSRLIKPGTQCFELGRGKLLLANNFHPKTLDWDFSDWVRKNIYRLRGKNLACWCPIGSPCHADVLLELANMTPPTAST